MEVLSLVQEPTTGDYLVSHGADLKNLDLITMPLTGVEDPLGDKFAGVAQTVYGPYLLTSGPVRDDNGRILGALMVAPISRYRAQDAGPGRPGRPRREF
jgi:hypothetical protein